MNKRDLLLAQKAIAARQVKAESKIPGSYSPMSSIKQKYVFPTVSPNALDKVSNFPKISEISRPSTTLALMKTHIEPLLIRTEQEIDDKIFDTQQPTPEQIKKQKLIEELAKSTLTPVVSYICLFSQLDYL